jgi:xanthine dehydrogenase accessory factor
VSRGARGGLPGFLDALHATHARGERAVLGIVYATSGSTYQKSGALVLLDENGLQHGVISGGCLEPELEERARVVHRSERSDTIDFDLRSDDDVVFGSGTGCHGRVRLLLVPQRHDAPLTQALHALGDSTAALELRLVVSGDRVGVGDASLSGSRWRWSGDGRVSSEFSGGGDVVQLHLSPPPRVLLLGTGAETIPLQEFVRQLGWRSCAVEHRGRWLGFAQRAGVDELLESPPQSAAATWTQRTFDAAVLMSHNYSIDLANLATCATTAIGYIGLLGPAARRDELLDELGADVAGSLRDRLHAPVGLPIGGSGPGALALSVAAELQAYFARRST